MSGFFYQQVQPQNLNFPAVTRLGLAPFVQRSISEVDHPFKRAFWRKFKQSILYDKTLNKVKNLLDRLSKQVLDTPERDGGFLECIHLQGLFALVPARATIQSATSPPQQTVFGWGSKPAFGPPKVGFWGGQSRAWGGQIGTLEKGCFGGQQTRVWAPQSKVLGGPK